MFFFSIHPTPQCFSVRQVLMCVALSFSVLKCAVPFVIIWIDIARPDLNLWSVSANKKPLNAHPFRRTPLPCPASNPECPGRHAPNRSSVSLWATPGEPGQSPPRCEVPPRAIIHACWHLSCPSVSPGRKTFQNALEIAVDFNRNRSVIILVITLLVVLLEGTTASFQLILVRAVITIILIL